MRYDFIIVGGGPAGSLLAAKLSANPMKNVLLLEAGGETQTSVGGKPNINGYLNEFDVPLLWTTVTKEKEYHWGIPNTLIAKGLGGCGIHNAMLYVRALESDFKSWNITG